MFLVNHHRAVLNALIKAQGKPNKDEYVIVNASLGTFYHCSGYYSADINAALSSDPDAAIDPKRIPEGELEEILEFLCQNGLVEKARVPVVLHVTQAGWHNHTIQAAEAVKMIMTHAVFPIIVSVITTLITLAFNR